MKIPILYAIRNAAICTYVHVNEYGSNRVYFVKIDGKFSHIDIKHNESWKFKGGLFFPYTEYELL